MGRPRYKRPVVYAKRGNSKTYLESLLQRNAEEYYERYRAGEYRTPMEACIATGLRDKQTTHAVTTWGCYRATWGLSEEARLELISLLLGQSLKSDEDRDAFAERFGWVIKKPTNG